MVFPYGQEAERWSGYVIDFAKKKKKSLLELVN